MSISEFLNILYSYCGNGDTPSDFVIKIFSQFTNEQENDFFDKSNDELRRIFNGKKNIKKTSISYILTHLKKGAFDTYLYDLLSEDSLIELSYKFEQYIGNTTTDTITTKITDLFISLLEKQISKNKAIESNNQIIINNENIYEEIHSLIRNINKLTYEEMTDIQKYEAFKVDKKIQNENAILKKEVKSSVVDYYTYIEKLFAESENSQLFFNFSNQVKKRCDDYIDDGLPQQIVFDNMCDWLKERTRCTSQTACRIVIAFFVQNCEVFHEIS